jgi:FecR-like protein
MEDRDKDSVDRDEEHIGRLLRAVGPREQLPQDLSDRWEEHFKAELDRVQSTGAHPRRWVMAAFAASVVTAVLLVTLMAGQQGDTAPAIRVTAIIGVSDVIDSEGIRQTLETGMTVGTGSQIETGQNGRAAIAYAGYDLRIDRDSRVEFLPGRIGLPRGQIYVSDDENRIGQGQLNIATPFGSIRDIGTQFTVRVEPRGAVTTVRRGAVIVDTGEFELRGEALPGLATQLTLDREGQLRTDQVAPSGDGWSWIYQAAPPYTLEGQTVYQFLQWSVGETGQSLEFVDTGAELYARRTVLHGSIEGLEPALAVTSVLASTDLTVGLVGHTLRVSLPDRQ